MNKKLVYILFLIGFVGLAQKNTVSIATDTTAIKIGEQIQLKITVNETNNVIFPKLQLDSLRKIEVIESLPVDTLKNRLEKKYVLTSFDSGQYILPKQQIIINNKKFFTDSLLINVATVKVDTLKQKMFPIKSIKKEPKTLDDYKYLLWWLIPILIVLAIVLYYIFRKKEKKETQKIYVTPINEALQRLKELDEKQLLQQNKIKIYYSELTDIVRTYLEKDMNIPALESTTNELIETINDFNESSNLGISKETIKQLKEVLQSADLVKFAKAKPIIEEIKRDRTIAENILKNTQSAVQIKQDESTDEDVQEMIVSQKTPSKNTNIFKKYIIAFVAVLVLVIGIVGYFSYKYFKGESVQKTASEMLDKKWYTSSYGSPEVTIETPKILQQQTIEIPENLKSIIQSQTTYNYGSLTGNIYIEVTSINFVNELNNFSYDTGIQAILKQISQKIGAKFTGLNEEIRVNNGVEGRIIMANYELEKNTMQQQNKHKFTLLFFANSKNIRQILVTQLIGDEKAEEVSNRIINSVSLKP
ncbi:hypothetical protein [Lutibacter sp.]|uniref:hypothetical protein n=1 Tax=Lutibacter sp. TaxID=1925666 RepID=UPI0025BA7132|nr:hypothetical protein [Lutibacter sp.]MCF6168116.1 hypothetical protein [Lutibacter sp.]